MADEKKQPATPAEKMVLIQYNKGTPHKIGAHRGGGESDATPPITLRAGLNHVPAAAWAVAKKLPVVQHHLTAKTVSVVREGKRVLVPVLEELGEAAAPGKPCGDGDAAKKKAEAEAKAKADAEAKAKAEREEAERKEAERKEAEAKKKAEGERTQQAGQQGRSGR